MEPLFFKAENKAEAKAPDKAESASMEPLFFKAENGNFEKCGTRIRWLQWSRFFSKRKMLDAAQALPVGEMASMEPLFFKAENSLSGFGCLPCLVLQWSRFFSKRKMFCAGVKHAEHIAASMEPLFFKAENIEQNLEKLLLHWRFNGAAFFQSGKSTPEIAVAIRPTLQWSRFFSKRKIGTKPADPEVLSYLLASMEPLFFKAENAFWQNAVPRRKTLASMEPLFFKAENFVDATAAVALLPRFNGAAFFQSGKSFAGQHSPAIFLMLQWSRFFSKRKIAVVSTNPGAALWASMEPLFFKAENGKGEIEAVGATKLQWSRFFSKRKIWR